MTQQENKPPFIETQTFRLLLETERPARFLRPEYFRAGRGARGTSAEQNLGNWLTVDRYEVVENCAKDDQGTACDLSRLVLTTDAGIGKTTEMHWLEAQLNRPDTDTAAFFLTFSELPPRVDDLLGEVLLPRLLRAWSDDVTLADNRESGQQVLEHLRREGRLVLLLDALDQAPADGSGADFLKQLLQDPRWQRCRIIVSGRPHALQRHWAGLFAVEHGFGWRFVQVDEFDETQQRTFLGQDGSGGDRYELIPAEAREILSTPRVLDYLRALPDGDLKRIQTAGDVYWLSVQHLLTEGMRNSERARQIGLTASETTPTNVQARSLIRARQLLGAIAFEMTSTLVVRRDPDSGEEHDVPNFDGVRQGRFAAFRERLLRRLSSPDDAPTLTRDLDGLAALNEFVEQGFFDTVEGLQEIFWRNRTLQEFFTAYWLSQHCTNEDVENLWDWVYLPHQPLTEEYYWVWRFLAEMHDEAVDPDAWARAVEPLFRPGDGTAAGTKRSTEIVYRAWDRLRQLADEGETAARNLLSGFLGEFEGDILSGNRGESARQISRQFRDSFADIPAGEFQMGAPPEKQGVPDDARKFWEEKLAAEGDPATRAERMVDEYFSFTPGKRGQEERQGEVAWWTEVLREGNLDAILRRQYPADETPVELLQQVDAFLLARSPTLNGCYRLFQPGHGVDESYFAKTFKEISPDGDTPVIVVTWYDAWVFCQWAHWEQTSCHLPREYEWEYAAKGGTPWEQNYWWGDEFNAEKCNGDQRVGRTTPPTAEHANPWGLVDMLGNVWEWTVDEYRTQYDRDKTAELSARVLRGGSWLDFAFSCRSACRDRGLPTNSVSVIGFRVARARKT